MLIVRDRRDGQAVSWGTDYRRMEEIAAGDPEFELWPDRGATRFYCHVERGGLAWVHPYDLSAQLEAEIKP
ncbi:hypothetical protein [Lentzea cavernae]|uniref:Uncharacterized protein n=1 Tax=Lentzea cavernae TaxID=2020703 RepID=A0ABQ3MSH1_9PSEU|nr:hypothetical protein [Lentzea cavernae]GHH57631.1 hypothetical protein GCM10017774_77470 [Lentzea cavernae]